MVVDQEVIPFLRWLIINVPKGMLCVIGLAVFFTFLGFLIAAFRHGPTESFYKTARVFFVGLSELVRVSPRRVLAIANLSFKESIRRRVLVAFAVFVLVLLFAGWFLDTGSEDPARLYIGFVLTSTTYLIMALSLFLSAFSLPSDIKSRTIYTVVTKPIYAWEIVLGKIVGFGAIGSVLLMTMALFSYVFVVRGLAHSHQVDAESLIEFHAEKMENGGEGGENPTKIGPVIGSQGRTKQDSNHSHRHSITLDAERQGETDIRKGHWHGVTGEGEGADVRYRVSGPLENLQARVPQYGKLRFLDRSGKLGKSISVGYEWTYRGYFEGGTLAAAIWTFEGVTPADYPEGLPIEMNIGVFRTHKADIEKTVGGSLVLRNPDPTKQKESDQFLFESEEYSTFVRHIPRKLTVRSADGKTQEVDIFDEYVDQGRIEILVRCEDRAQYFGVAQADVYLRKSSRSFAWNFAKGYLGIWLQMIVVIGFGVMFSTFLSAPVAMMSTLATIVLGFYKDKIIELATSVFQGGGSIKGGGPIEALIRLVTQMNLTLDLGFGKVTTVIESIDAVIMSIMWSAVYVLPNYGRLDNVNYVADGYNIPSALCSQQSVAGIAYVLALSCAGYFLLKTREIAA